MPRAGTVPSAYSLWSDCVNPGGVRAWGISQERETRNPPSSEVIKKAFVPYTFDSSGFESSLELPVFTTEHEGGLVVFNACPLLKLVATCELSGSRGCSGELR